MTQITKELAQSTKIRWGILGAGEIIDKWICGARQLDNMEIVAIASRTHERAEYMAIRHAIPEVLTYEELVQRPDIDVVYIPVPHTFHKALAMLAMENGKSVLVEKPAAVNQNELTEMIACAQKNNVFFMEGMWTRFFPLVDKIKTLIQDGRIGEVRNINVSFSFLANDLAKEHRLRNPQLAGGGLLDTGVYNLHFASAILDSDPDQLSGFALMDTVNPSDQVDNQASFTGVYKNQVLVNMNCGFSVKMPEDAIIYGTRGHIEIPRFWRPTSMTIVTDEKTEIIDLPVEQKNPDFIDTGFQYEIDHVNSCLRQNLLQSPLLPWYRSLSIIRQCDQLRAQWHLKYQFEA